MNQRTALGDMLQQLLKQKDQRELQLRQVLVREAFVVPRSFFFVPKGSFDSGGHLFVSLSISCCSLVAPLLCFAGGDGGEVRLHPAELLDDSIPEAAGCQAAVFANAGTAVWWGQSGSTLITGAGRVF